MNPKNEQVTLVYVSTKISAATAEYGAPYFKPGAETARVSHYGLTEGLDRHFKPPSPHAQSLRSGTLVATSAKSSFQKDKLGRKGDKLPENYCIDKKEGVRSYQRVRERD